MVNYMYQNKPKVIEAFQMTKERRWDNKDWPPWLHKAWNTEGEGCLAIDPDCPKKERLYIGTLEGVHKVSWGDWIIKGVKGEIYPCKPDIFAMTYEPAVRPVEKCSFCGKLAKEVVCLVSSQPQSSPENSFMCNDCTMYCLERIWERKVSKIWGNVSSPPGPRSKEQEPSGRIGRKGVEL